MDILQNKKLRFDDRISIDNHRIFLYNKIVRKYERMWKAVMSKRKKESGSLKRVVIAVIIIVIAVAAGLGAGKILSGMKSSKSEISEKSNVVKSSEGSDKIKQEKKEAEKESDTAEMPDVTESTEITKSSEETEAKEEIPEATVAPVNESQSSTEDTDNEHMVYTSKHMWEQDGEIYTVNDVHMKGFHCMSGNYADSMILYDKKIYLKKIFAEGEPFAQIIRMDLDGNNQEILTNNMQGNTKMCIYDGYLYYTYRNENGEKSGHRQNLETGEEEDLGAHIFRDGNDHLWVSTNGKGTVWSISEPCYKNIRKTDQIKGSMLGINGDKIYYVYQENDGTYTTCAYNAKTDKSSKIIMGMSAKSIIAGDGLYYKYVADGKTTLYRWDLNDKNRKESFDLGEFNLYMGGGFNEVGDRIFLTQFTPENGQNNTELWELSHTSGKLERVATWYNPNAEAAAQEP